MPKYRLAAVGAFVIAGLLLFAVGLFDDLIVDHAGALLFQEKTVVCDSPRIDTLLVIPL